MEADCLHRRQRRPGARDRRRATCTCQAPEGLDLDALQSQIEAYDAWNWEQRVEETLHRLHLDRDGPGRLALRRHPQARRPGPGAGGRTRRAAARRADQSPGPRLDRVAGAAADRLQGQRGHHHPRPQLPEPRRDPHRRAGPRQAELLSRQLRAVPAAEGRAARPGSGDQRQGRQAAGAGRDLDPQGRGGAPHAQPEPHQPPAGAARQPRRPARRAGQRQHGRGLRPVQRQDRGRADRRLEVLRRQDRRSATSAAPSCAATRSA